MFRKTIIFFISIAVLTATFTGVNFAKTNKEYIEITVKKGDTLWSLAEKYSNKNDDIRNKLIEIKKLNKKQNYEIREGEVIKIPID